MPNPEQLERLRQGVEGWNKWRDEHPDERVDLTEANLSRADLSGAKLWRANLSGAFLSRAQLREACLQEADLSGADLARANLPRAVLTQADLSGATLWGAVLVDGNLQGAVLSAAELHEANLARANLSGAGLVRAVLTQAYLPGANLTGATLWGAVLVAANLQGADLSGAVLSAAELQEANLTGANLTGANLREANLTGANLARANLSGADLSEARLVRTHLERADLTGCRVYGTSAWDVHSDKATQMMGLVITPKDTAIITVDNLEVAQFIYLLLNNENIRTVIDTITSKVVLILGRFTPERKAVLDALRDTLRTKNYSPVVFDFEKPANRDLTETIRVLAGMARFVIADITDARSIPQELMAIVPDLPSVPVQPLLLASQREYGMFEHFRRFQWVLKEQLYDSPAQLVRDVESSVIAPAESWLKARHTKA